MTPTANSHCSRQLEDNVTMIIALVEDLITVIDAENRELGTGVPASLSSDIERKAVLAAQLEYWVEQVCNGALALNAATPHQRYRLDSLVATLDKLVIENVARLRAAIDATRGRVDTVMRVIRELSETPGSYRSNGRTESHFNPGSSRSGRLA